MNSIGIVGFGSFGSLLANLLAPHLQVVVYDKAQITETLPSNVRVGSLAKVAACDGVVIAVDLSGVREVCAELAGLVRPETIVMDICSVKVVPSRIMHELLSGKCQLLATHPLFGPNSVAANGNTAKGMAMMWHELSGGPFPELEALFVRRLGVRLARMTPEEHDQQMAWVHGLTFFVGRGLAMLKQPDISLETGYYQKLRDLVELENTHSLALFNTIEAGNPYVSDVRHKFMAMLQSLDTQIEEVRYD